MISVTAIITFPYQIQVDGSVQLGNFGTATFKLTVIVTLRNHAAFDTVKNPVDNIIFRIQNNQ